MMCKFCEGYKSILFEQMGGSEGSYNLYVDKGDIVVDIEGRDGYDGGYTAINYCPMCGRELNGGEAS